MLRRAGILVLGAISLFAATPSKNKPPVISASRQARALLRSLSLRDKIAQLVIGVCDGDAYSAKSPEFQKYRHWVRDLHIGGLIVNNSTENGIVRNAEPHVMALFLNQMQKLARVPLLVGSDFERGASMRVSGATRFPFNMAYGAAGDVEGARLEGLAAAREARALGVQWIFAPVADVNNNPDNPIINLRSYGEDPDLVARFVAAYIDGAHSDPDHPVLVTAKHFPGHGDTAMDSHMGLARLDATRERMDALELKPFAAAIAHGVDAVMTAHMAVPAVEPDPIPATVSPKVLTGLLRHDLNFSNLIVTDAMDMLGLTSLFSGGESSVRALLAGADVLLMPPDPEKAIRAVAAAVASGRLSRARLDESVLRVLSAKLRIGLMKKKLVDLDQISDALDVPETAERAQQVSDRAMTLLRNENSLLPLAHGGEPCLVAMNGSRLSIYGQRLVREFQKRAPSARAVIVDSSMPLAALDAVLGDPASCSSIVVAAYVTASAYRGNVALNGDLAPFLERLAAGPVKVTLLSLGSPYLVMSFPKVAAYLAAFSTTVPSEVSAVKALFGEMPVTGRTPVTIPGFANRGDGIQLAVSTH